MSFIYTASGVEFSYETFDRDSIKLTDIAHALSQLCRYTGHTIEFWSVAQHSLLVSEMVEEEHPEFMLEALLHDATEAYINDLASPLKATPAMQEYVRLEDRLYRTIAEKFEITYPLPRPVLDADKLAITIEAPVLLQWRDGTHGLRPVTDTILKWRKRLCEIVTWERDKVFSEFLHRAMVLINKRRCIL